MDFVALVEAALDRLKLRGPAADPKTPVILQTFGESTARALAARKIGVPVVFLFDVRGHVRRGGDGGPLEGRDCRASDPPSRCSPAHRSSCASRTRPA